MMDKTIKINLAGILFQIDEEAYNILRDYLQAINNRFRNVTGGNETVEDIESRIAEIFQSQKGITGVISKENVEAMMSLMGKPEDFDLPEKPGESSGFSDQKRCLYRNPDETIISGVCAGIGAYLNIDPVWIRILFILFIFFFGIGFFVYIALWIALPSATTDTRKRELYGSEFHSEANKKKKAKDYYSSGVGSENQVYQKANNVGGAFNEIFKALGKFLFIVFRIITIILGVAFALTGFISLLIIIMVLFFKNPGFIPSEAISTSFFYLPDFLNFIVNPSLTPRICVLTFLVIFLPLLALIYWGIKMIFWFRAHDGAISLIGLILWALSVTALSVILANEGFSFSETGRTSSQFVMENSPDTLYIITGRKIKDLEYDREINIPDESYSVFTNNNKNELSIRVRLGLFTSDDNSAKVEVRKRSAGQSKTDAAKKAEGLPYDYRISNDTLYLDEYFTLPAGTKWAGDYIAINLSLPEGTVLFFDDSSENFFEEHVQINSEPDYSTESWELGRKFWIIKEGGLKETKSGYFR